MTAEQKLEKCKELVEKWRGEIPKMIELKEGYGNDSDWKHYESIAGTLARVSGELQAILEEDDEPEGYDLLSQLGENRGDPDRFIPDRKV